MLKHAVRTIAALAIAGVASIGTAASADTTGGGAAKPITIGAAIGFTALCKPFEGEEGAFATVRMAVEDINRTGGVLGRRLKLVTSDMKCDPALGPAAALNVIRKGADVLLVTCDFDQGSPAARVAQERGFVAMSICAGSHLFGPKGIGPLAFTAGMAAQTEAAVGAEWAYRTKRWRTAYILTDNSLVYQKNWAEGFEDRWVQLAGKRGILGKDSFLNSDPSVAAQITRLKQLSKQPDFIALQSYPPGGAAAVRQLRAAGIRVPILGNLSMDGTYWINAVPQLGEFYNTGYASYYGNDSDKNVNDIYRRFLKRVGKPPVFSYYITGYQAVQILAEGIRRAGKTEGKAVARALESLKGVPFLLGPTTYTKEFHISFERPASITGIRNGKPFFVGRFFPEKVPKPRGGK